jgi:hypothetical protein
MEPKLLLDQLLDHSTELFAKVNPSELCSNIDQQNNCRPGLLVAAFNHLRSYGPDINHIVDPASSDEASDPELAPPSMEAVVDSLLDSTMACITVRTSQDTYKPSEQPPALIFIHLDTSVLAKSLTRVFAKLSKCVLKVQVVDFATERGLTHCGIVTLSCPEEAQRLFTKFKLEQARGVLAARLHTIPGAQRNVQVKWFFNKALDSSENWNAVVLRNLKRGCTVEEVQRVVSDPVIRIERPREVQGTWCTLVVLKNIEDCERMSLNLNRRRLNSGERIKAHVHPHSCFFKRPRDSHHRIFNTATLGKRPRQSSGGPRGSKLGRKGVLEKPEDIKNLVSQIMKACSLPVSAINANPLTELIRDKTEEPPLEEGEIHEPLKEVEELEKTENYRLFEFGGVSYTCDVGVVRHSGIYIKTSHANEILEANS